MNRYKVYLPGIQSFLQGFLPEELFFVLQQMLLQHGVNDHESEIQLSQLLILFGKIHLQHVDLKMEQLWTVEMEEFYTCTIENIPWDSIPEQMMTEEEKKQFFEEHWKLFSFSFIFLVDWIRQSKIN